MPFLRALRAGLLALALVWLPALGRAEANSSCATDDCGCPHAAPASECCCDGGAAQVRVPASAPTREELLAELEHGPRRAGPVLNDGACRRTRRSLLELRSTVPSAQPAPESAPRPRAPERVALRWTASRPDVLEPEPSTPPPRPARV